MRPRQPSRWIEVGVATGSFVAGLVFLASYVSTTSTAVGETIGTLSYVWSSLLMIGGPFVLIGRVRHHLGFEVAGLSLLSTSYAIESVALFSQRGPAGAVIACLFLGLSLGMAGRIVEIAMDEAR